MPSHNNKKMRPETVAALKSIFDHQLINAEFEAHLVAISVATILALRQVAGDEFVKGLLTGALQDIEEGNDYIVARLGKRKVNH